MVLKDALRSVVRSQLADLKRLDIGVNREVLERIGPDSPLAIVLSGIRRCGKSTLLRQLMKGKSKFYYFNFEDPRVTGFDVSDFQKLDEVFLEELGTCDHYFFDEIQNVEKWELFVRMLLDKKKHVVLTGSNASLLSKELGTRLTGRHLRFEVFPFSFKEFMRFTGQQATLPAFDDYLSKGGFPEFLKLNQAQVLHELLQDIIARDIVVRHGLKNPKRIQEMLTYLISNAGKEFSYNSLKKTFELGSVNTVRALVSYFEDSYLLFTLPRFDFSYKKQLVNPKKTYCVDTGFALANSASFSQDNGRILENTVFLQLRRRHSDIYYFKEKKECDFVIKEKNKITRGIQVCWELTVDNQQRETDGLLEALHKFNLSEGLLLTHHQKDRIVVGKKTIHVKPVWEWLIE